MRIVLPKEIRGYHFPRLFSVEMNDFDIERLLPSLFYLVITSGRGRGGRKNKPTEFQAYLDRLAQHSRVKGFDESSSRRMLNRWVRAAVVQMGRLGRGGGKGEQIEYALPNTILTYTTDFQRRFVGRETLMYSSINSFAVFLWENRPPTSAIASTPFFAMPSATVSPSGQRRTSRACMAALSRLMCTPCCQSATLRGSSPRQPAREK